MFSTSRIFLRATQSSCEILCVDHIDMSGKRVEKFSKNRHLSPGRSGGTGRTLPLQNTAPSETPLHYHPPTPIKNPGPYHAPLYEFCLTPHFGRGNETEKHGNSPGKEWGFQAGIREVTGSNVPMASGRANLASAGPGADPQAQTPWRAKFRRRATLSSDEQENAPEARWPGRGCSGCSILIGI